MSISWKVTFDPLRLLESDGPFTRLEGDAREQGEDIIQMERSGPGTKKIVLDLGWYRNRYRINLIEDSDWSSPVQSIECADLDTAMAAFVKLAL